MPTGSAPRIRPASVLLSLAACAAAAVAQTRPGGFIPSDHPLSGAPLFRYTLPYHMARLTPATGPDAAPFNPARLAEARRWSSQLSLSNEGRVDAMHTGGAAVLPGAVALGFTAVRIRGSAHGTSTVYHEQRAALQAAWRFPGTGTGPGLAIGYSLVQRILDVWGLYRESDVTHDLGLAWRPAGGIRGWKPDFGLALRDLIPMHAYIPDAGTGVPARYRVYPRNADATLALASPGGVLAGWLSFRGEERQPRDDRYGAHHSSGPGIGARDFEIHFHRYGLAWHPRDFLSVRLETPGYGVRQAGATLKADPWLRWRLEADVVASYGPYYSYARPLESGVTLTGAIRAGW